MQPLRDDREPLPNCQQPQPGVRPEQDVADRVVEQEDLLRHIGHGAAPSSPARGGPAPCHSEQTPAQRLDPQAQEKSQRIHRIDTAVSRGETKQPTTVN